MLRRRGGAEGPAGAAPAAGDRRAVTGRRDTGERIGAAARWAMIALLLSWTALSVLGNVDVAATARLFAAIKAGADRVAHLG